MKTLGVLTSLMTVFLLGAPALAEKMDSETQNHVVDRLERVLSNLDKKETAYVSTSLRLGDLLAERARQRFMNEVEANCQGCKGSVADRKRAIKLYEDILGKTSNADHEGVILFQLAHLYEMSGEPKKSSKLFERILNAPKGRYSKDLTSRSRTSYADSLFNAAKYKQALKHYEIALKDPQIQNRGLITYRVAWCEFNMDKLAKGTRTLEKLLSSPELLTKETTKGPAYDSGFHADIVRDLAGFYTRQTVTDREIRKYKELSPNDHQKELLEYFGSEADRLGQKQAAYKIYQSMLEEPNLSKEEKLDLFVRLAQIKYDMGQGKESTEDFALAAVTYKDLNCKDAEKCAEIQKRMKKYVTEMHRSKKSQMTIDVLKAYYIYSKTFADDAEMAILGAQVGIELKQYVMAAQMYRIASASKKEKLQQTALMGEIEAAELSKKLELREAAYQNYLSVSPKGPFAFQARYQLAQVLYERKEWNKAAHAFRELAMDTSGSQDLRKKSADLALDCLAIEKRDAEIETWAAGFARAFPSNRDEYMRISRKSVMNQVASATNGSDSSGGDLRGALSKMAATDLTGASDAEKILHYKNMSVVAQKAGNDSLVMTSLASLLAVKSLSAADREDALARQVGIHESRLEFASAYRVAIKMKFSGLSKAQKEFRLGTLADLGGLSPSRHYQNALAYGLSGASAQSVRVRLVMISANPVKELRKHKNELSRNTAVMSDVVSMVYAKTRDARGVQQFLNMRGMSNSPAAIFIRKQPYYVQHQQLSRQIARQQLNSRSDALLQRTIKDRMILLVKADRSLVDAVRLNDYTAQAISLNTVARENARMVQELMSLPMPRKLTKAQQQQYSALLNQQAMPFAQKAKFAEQKLQEFWGNQRAMDRLIADFENARPEMKSFFRDEIRLLAMISSGGVNSKLESALNESPASRNDLIAARESVRDNPVSAKEIEKLKTLETKIGHPLMSSYLESRLERIQGKEI